MAPTQLLIFLSIPLLALATTPSLNVTVTQRQPDSITISWEVIGSSDDIDSYQVKVNDESNDFTITYEGQPYINYELNEAVVKVHESDKQYNICVVAMLKEERVESDISTVVECITASSIRTMQSSSIVSLVLTLLFFILCFVAGYVSWKCASRRVQSSREYEKSEVNGNGDIVPLTHIED